MESHLGVRLAKMYRIYHYALLSRNGSILEMTFSNDVKSVIQHRTSCEYQALRAGVIYVCIDVHKFTFAKTTFVQDVVTFPKFLGRSQKVISSNKL